ncbi:hypothetical protein D3C77_741080 [compost metagenome]
MRQLAAYLEGNEGIGIPMENQRRNVEFLQVVAEISVAERRDAVQRSLRRSKGGNVQIVNPEWLTNQVRPISCCKKIRRKRI